MNADPTLVVSSAPALWVFSKGASRLRWVQSQVRAMEGVKLLGWVHLDISGNCDPSWLQHLKRVG